MDSRRRIILSLCLTLFFLVAGTVGYIFIERYTLLEAVYMTVITITTVGYGEIHALSETGRLFTIFLLLFGVGSLAFAAHAFTESMIERAWSPARGKRVMKKRISQLTDHTIICGHGRVGEAAARHLADSQRSFVVLESSPEQCVILKERGYLYLSEDATREQTLRDAGIKSAGALLALLDSDPDNLFTVLTARELNPTLHIVARSESASAESRILRAGADSIISPYASAGRKVADKIMARAQQQRLDSKMTESIPSSQPRWFKVNEESGLIDHAVEAAGIFLEGQIVGIRRDGKDMLAPTADTRLVQGDMLLVVHVRGVEVNEVRLEQPQKIVLVDDNPVIRRLYTRLFQKAGFNIITASTGREGCDLILEEKPDAAVVDYRLADISGLEICEFVRKSEGGQDVKLFLFTADESLEVRENALKVGVDVVVLKSPDAGEIVNLVRREVAKKEKG
ncbi:MAG: NAD-binding protein [Proteobacteria bacterium]|nr:NAD-binding protein [Pseudomonadota bacterium]MBU1419933.1 NAD-binding protein [Pseudomonadota bacterium]MBU1454652.1 NAD-binding protein [Pseudomonadota bacterium]